MGEFKSTLAFHHIFNNRKCWVRHFCKHLPNRLWKGKTVLVPAQKLVTMTMYFFFFMNGASKLRKPRPHRALYFHSRYSAVFLIVRFLMNDWWKISLMCRAAIIIHFAALSRHNYVLLIKKTGSCVCGLEKPTFATNFIRLSLDQVEHQA